MFPVLPSNNSPEQNWLLERVIADAPIGIAFLEGPAHMIKIANPVLYQVFPNRGELIGRSPEELFPELGNIVRERIDRVYQTGEPFRLVDVRIPFQRDGQAEDRYFTYSLTPVHAAAEQIQGVLCLIRESTEEVRARQALEQANRALTASEERMKIAQQVAEIGVWEWDARTNQVWWSPQTYAIYGYPLYQRMTLETSLERVHPEEVSSVYARMLAAIQTHTDFRHEYRMVHPERGARWLEGFARILYGPDGQAQRMVGTVRDITARKEMESTLRESLERERSRAAELAAVMDAVPAMVLVTHDPAGRNIVGNRMANEMLQAGQGANLSKTAPAGQAPLNFRMLRSGQEIPPDELPVQLAAKGIALRNYDYSLVLEDGSRTDMIGNATPLFDSNGRPTGAVAAFVDITGQTQADEELRRLNAELHQRVTEQETSQRKLQKLIEVSNRITAAQRLPELFQELVGAAAELSEAGAGLCGRPDSDGKFLAWAASGEPGSLGLLSGWAEAPGLAEDLIGQSPSFRLPRADLPGLPGGLMGARLAAPDDQAEGVLLVAGQGPGDFSAEDEALLEQLAALASLRLRQIRIREAAEHAGREAARRMAEAEESQRVLEVLMEYVPEGITIAEGPDVLIRMVSRYGRELLGAAVEQITVGQALGESRVYAEDGARPLPVEELPLSKAIRKGEVVINQRLVQINAAGLPLLLSWNAAPIRNRSGVITGGVAAWRDITDLRQAQDALRNSEARFRVASASMAAASHPGSLFSTDRGLRYTWLHNLPAGLGEKMVLGKRSDQIRPPEDTAELVALQQAVIDTGKAAQKEIRVKVSGEWVRYLVTMEALLNDQGRVTGVTGALLEV